MFYSWLFNFVGGFQPGLGIASFVVSFVGAGIAFFLLLMIIGLSEVEEEWLYEITGFIIIVDFIMLLTSLGMAIPTLFNKQYHKGLSIAGLVISASIIMVSVMLIILSLFDGVV